MTYGTDGINEADVKPPDGGTPEVSPQAAPKKKKKNTLPLPFPIVPSDMNDWEYAQYNREKQKKSLARAKEKKLLAEFLYTSKTEPTKPEAYEILEGRGVGIRNAHVLTVAYGLLLQAAEQNDIAANRFLFANGIRASLKSFELEKAQPLSVSEPTESVSGELLNCAELFAIFDCSGEAGTFEEFLQVRQNCKRDCFYLGKEILDRDFVDCHRIWTDFFPKFDPSALPSNYTQKEMIRWLDGQSVKKDWLMLASRNSFKSSWSHIWLLSLILCCPDIRVLLVSETKPLSKDFIGAIRSYFEVIKNQETRFQRLFPEFSIPMGDGSVLSLDCPMARLRLPQTCESTSMDSAVAGRRADVILFDDPISSTSCGNAIQCAASVSKYDAVRKLREVGGLVVVLGTPWRAEIDLYAVLLKRNEEDDDKPLSYRLDPAWTLKPEYVLNDEGKSRGLREIEEHMVTLLFPERLSWKFLRSELKSSLAFFASQNLIIFPTFDADADIRCTFDEVKLREHVKPREFFASSLTSKAILTVDTAFSTAMTADFSCLTTIKILKHEGKDAAVVWDVDMGRWPYSDLAVHVVLAIEKHRPTEVVIEKDRTWATLEREIMKAAAMRGVLLPHVYWFEPSMGSTSSGMRSKRVKALEPLLANDQLWFISANWTDQCLDQLKKFDGLTKSNASRKDDFPISLSIGLQFHFPFHDGKPIEKSADQKKAEEDAANDWKRREIYKRYFGTAPVNLQPEPEQPEENNSPLFRGVGSALRRR